MKKLIMICLVLVMLLTTGVTPRGTYADDGEDYQPGDWRQWLSEDEWKHVSPEIQNDIGRQMFYLRLIAGDHIIGLRYAIQNPDIKDTDWQVYLDYASLVESCAAIILDIAESSAWKTEGRIVDSRPTLQRKTERCSVVADALKLEAEKEKPDPALIARYLAAINGYTDSIDRLLPWVEAVIKSDTILYAGRQQQGDSDEGQGSDTEGDKGGGADRTDGEKSLEDILDDFMAEVGVKKVGEEEEGDKDKDGAGEKQGDKNLIEQFLQLLADIFEEEEGEKVAAGERKGDEEDKKGGEDRDGGVQEEDAVDLTQCSDFLILASFRAEWQKTVEKAVLPAANEAFISLVEKGSWKDPLEFFGAQPFKIQAGNEVIAEGVKGCEVVFTDKSYGEIETVTATIEYSMRKTGETIHQSIYGRDLPLVNKGEEDEGLCEFRNLAQTTGAGPIYVYGGSCLLIEDIKWQLATSRLVGWNCNREDARFYVIFGNNLQALWDRAF